MSTIPAAHERKAVSLFQRDIVVRALIDSFKKLDPRVPAAAAARAGFCGEPSAQGAPRHRSPCPI